MSREAEVPPTRFSLSGPLAVVPSFAEQTATIANSLRRILGSWPLAFATMTLDEICDNVRQLSTAHGWNQTDPAVRMIHVTAEVGELADALTKLLAAPSDDQDAARADLGHEIFDVVWNLCALANATGVDLEQAAVTKMAANAQRAWS